MTVEEWLGEDNQLGTDIWTKKYCNEGESFDEWVGRISGGNEEIAQYIREKKFLFGGRILSNRGLDKEGRKVTYSNCYVVDPPEDNIESIFDCAKKLARTYSYGGGCGVDISKLSPRGARINNAAKETSGSVSFMELYSLVTALIGQNGRRGALMISIDCSHPDVEEFIDLKTDLEKVTKANISVRIHEDFMEAVKKNEDYLLHYTREATGQVIEKQINARELFRKIAETNWDYAEPGALFWDRIEGWNLLSNTKDFSYAGVNPCAEEPLPAGGSCLLGSINLSAFVNDPFTDHAQFDFEGLKHCVEVSVGALNEVLEEGLPLHPLEEQQESVARWRQIGLGIMGLADCLIKLGLAYGEEDAVAMCDKIGFAMADSAIAASAKLAKEKGAYPACEINEVMSTPYFLANTSEKTRELVKKYGLRNSQLLTIAPTGTLSTMLGISGGIEPVYANYYERKTESLHGTDVYYKVYTKIVETYMKQFGIKSDAELPDYFVTAMTLDYRQRIDMQSVWQQHIDASISSTVNVPNGFTVEETEGLYMYAYEKGLKGITIFRDGCKRIGILNTDLKKEKKEVTAGEGLKRGEILLVTDDVVGKKRKLVTGCGSLHCIALFDPNTGALLETYLSKGSTGGCNNFMVGLSRMISISARGGISIETIVDQLNSSGSCPSYTARRVTRKDTSRGACCPMAVGNALMDMYNEMQAELAAKENCEAEKPVKKVKKVPKPKAVSTELDKDKMYCPECGEPLIFEEGCNICKSCGWSKCH
ncbi:adenosylcobalamin-dependent ribonucleoside-diphosphate reductase [Faecalicatena contorta]|uniref:Vitamin B12-dependent ribonucleotide reductase n=1 Tax=Faecalicatena fissicatena TaxID=290055 RepID=A0ABS2EAR2_9FIRM|nr:MULTISPECIES: adenosylcobalamin-dependent ribonucleoside-diphosphate reductase [Clostridia]MBM6686458.1 adenosylcobalamin-dependent ribonucleoside-diphosphate reductase [Faecalicatena contorta]MBM6710706.1 adenosylcobalamin-dependent ribonucleoside-diphosphate reductase [Faecalicatena contorta]MBM6738662.1 adenosylcobalamin-dependent ribonucleoside-diphosphate reductase [Faecalicatena fissicatena]HIY00121.1 adenosylcobalamin-dependent ribonucleoside-diphosphate reductase [Candidatus Dorea in